MDYSGKIITKNAVTPTQTAASGVWTLDDALQAQKGNNWPIPGVPNPISKSLRFNQADDTYLNRTPAIAGNRTIWTWSAWVKRATISDFQYSLYAGGSSSNPGYDEFRFTTADKFRFFIVSSGSVVLDLLTTQVFRDPSAWYHFVVAYDSTQATASNRAKIYVNGSQITAFDTATYPAQNTNSSINNSVAQTMGLSLAAGFELNGYLTEINFIDGQALAASDFGMTDTNTGVWIPKKYTGTYGTNGFYVNFKDATNTSTLGLDYSGNGNNWNANNFSVTAGAGNDSLTDVPTPWVGYSVNGDTGGVVRGNYATLNPLQNALTLANGNLDNTQSGGGAYAMAKSTFGLSTGKWYWEVLITARPTIFDSRFSIGISSPSETTGSYVGSTSGGYGIFGSTSVAADGSKVNNGSFTAVTGAGFTTNDVLMFAFDADAGKLWFGKNGTWLESGAPASGTNAQFTSIPAGTYLPAISSYSGTGYTSSASNNFGQRPFAYTPPAGFKSLCTTNLPTPTIGATSTTQAGKYFNAVLWTGNNTARTITGYGFQPDLIWAKSRDVAANHRISDAVRGSGGTYLYNLSSSTTGAENTDTDITGFASDGFTLGGSVNHPNVSPYTYVGWGWKANGAGVTNTAGTITSTVSANTTAGFSIVTYTGNGTNGATVGHGLNATPQFIIVKRRNSASSWQVRHVSLPRTTPVQLESTAAASTNLNIWANPLDSTVFAINDGSSVNAASQTYVAYVFAPIAGYSAFGSYTGNGNANGPFIYTGFRPAFLMTKRTNTTGDWYIWDATRSPSNAVALNIWPNLSSAEYNYGADGTQPWDFLSNGFKARVDSIINNTNGDTYIYMAFAQNPFKFSNAR